jgi:chaperonin GroEL
MLAGINQIASAILPTLGAYPRRIAIDQPGTGMQPELLDNGALIARRIVQLPDAAADMGAMLLRQMLWQLYEQVGDGSATAAVLFETVVREGIRYITAGGNAQQLRKHLLTGLEKISAQLLTTATPITDATDLSQFILSVTHQQDLTDILSEVFQQLGMYARIDLRNGFTHQYSREYVEGILWDGGLHATSMMLDGSKQRTALENVAVFVSDLAFQEAIEILPIIDAAAYHHRGLIVVADQVSEKVIGLMNYINQQNKPFKVIAVKLPGDAVARQDMIEDLVHTVGGRAFRAATGDLAKQVRENDLGKATSIWANRDYFCIVEPYDNALRTAHMLNLETQYKQAKPEHQTRILRRIGQLMGASVTIFIGGLSKAQIEQNKEQLEGYIKVISSAHETGLLAGGGVALLRCIPLLQTQLASASTTDEKAALRILERALEAPTRAILENAGINAGTTIAQIRNHVYYMLNEQVELTFSDTPLILDSAQVVIHALESAIRSAALALSIDVLVHHRNPEFSATP